MIAEFRPEHRRLGSPPLRHVLELEFLAKDGSSRWCEVVSTYLRDEGGVPKGMLGITRDVTRASRGGTGIARIGKQTAQPFREPAGPRGDGRPRRTHPVCQPRPAAIRPGTQCWASAGSLSSRRNIRRRAAGLCAQAIASGLASNRRIAGYLRLVVVVPDGAVRQRERHGRREARHGDLHRHHASIAGPARRSRRNNNCCGDCWISTNASGS